jgi:hypothetical protein
VYNYVFTLLLLIFVVLPIGYYFFFADIMRGSSGKEIIVLHDTALMGLTYIILACDVPALLYVAYLGYRREQNEIHSLSHFLLIILSFGNTIAYPFALEFIHGENLSILFLLYPLIFPFLSLISIFINRRLPEVLSCVCRACLVTCDGLTNGPHTPPHTHHRTRRSCWERRTSILRRRTWSTTTAGASRCG